MEIVFLDAGTVDLGDIALAPLKKAGRYRSFRDSSPSQIVARARGAEVIVTNKCVLGAKEIGALPRLRLICVAATGVNNIDLEAAKSRGIAVANVAGYSTATVAEHALMFLLALSHRLIEHHEGAKTRWIGSSGFALLDRPYADLEGKTLGIIGYGHIGRRVAALARAFGMKVAIAKLPGRRYASLPKRVPLARVLASSHFVTLHCPLTPATYHLINKARLKHMKRGSYLVNLARGAVVDEQAVARALLRGGLAGYGVDTLAIEPPPRDHPLFDRRLRDKVIMTPHVAWASRESRQRLIGEIAANIRAFEAGRRRNRVA